MRSSVFVLIAATLLYAPPAVYAEIVVVGVGDTSIAAYLGGGAVATQTFKQGSGTGNFAPFLSIHSNRDDEWGYNTAGGLNLDDVNGGTRTHLITLDQIPTVLIGNSKYREFVLDTNQAGQQPLSLNQIQIFAGAAATDAPYPAGGATPTNCDVSPGLGMTPMFQLNHYPSGPITEIQVPAAGSGSGHADLILYVPNSVFAGRQAGDYITVFSQFGTPPGAYKQSDGFEEWGVRENTGGFGPGPFVPEPSAVVLLSIGLAGLLACAWRRWAK
jgi:hypothetical protein